ncbi:MAG TPA: hypothetical protein PLZ74_05620, partial [Kiritimatiellia bacterium]|nr:hypothetical protein [Kiritimatiellia bacterium]
AIGIGIDCFTTEHFLGFQGFWFQGFRVSSGSGSLSGSGSIVSPQNTFFGFKVSGFKVSWFQGFWVSGFMVSGFMVSSGSGSLSLSGSTVSPQPHSLTAFEVAGFARISIRQPCDAGADGPESGAARWRGGFPANRRRSILLLLGLIL